MRPLAGWLSALAPKSVTGERSTFSSHSQTLICICYLNFNDRDAMFRLCAGKQMSTSPAVAHITRTSRMHRCHYSYSWRTAALGYRLTIRLTISLPGMLLANLQCNSTVIIILLLALDYVIASRVYSYSACKPQWMFRTSTCLLRYRTYALVYHIVPVQATETDEHVENFWAKPAT